LTELREVACPLGHLLTLQTVTVFICRDGVAWPG